MLRASRERGESLLTAAPERYREIALLHRDYRDHVRDLRGRVREGGFHVDSVELATRSVLSTCDSLEWHEPDDDLRPDDPAGLYADLVLHHQLGHPR